MGAHAGRLLLGRGGTLDLLALELELEQLDLEGHAPHDLGEQQRTGNPLDQGRGDRYAYAVERIRLFFTEHLMTEAGAE